MSSKPSGLSLPALLDSTGGLISFESQSVVDTRLLVGSTAKSILIVSDNAEALSLAREIAREDRKVTFLFSEERAQDDGARSGLEGDLNLTVSSLDELRDVPFSNTETRCASIAGTLADELARILHEIAGQDLSDELIRALTFGLQNNFYYDALRHSTVGYCLDNFDSALLLIDDVNRNADVIRSFQYHGRASGKLGEVFFASLQKNNLQAVRNLFNDSKAAPADRLGERVLAVEFSALWKALNDGGDRYSRPGGYVAICGNVVNNSRLSSQKLVEILARRSDFPLLFHSSVLMSTSGREEAKDWISDIGLSQRCTVYEGGPRRFRETYPAAVVDKLTRLFQRVFVTLSRASRENVPGDLLDVLAPRLLKYVRDLTTQVIFAHESMSAMTGCKLVATALDRTIVSRILCAIAKDKGIPSIGIQPLILSMSSRYRAPAVDCMGVIDTAQLEIHRSLGAHPGSLEVIGSANYIERLREIEAREAELEAPADKRTILFVMQHSNAGSMIATSLALRDIAERNDLRLIVKPHPQQDLFVQHEVRRIYAQSTNAIVLPIKGDTYAAVAKSAIVVGLNSNVLLEAALSGKPVLVAALGDLHPSSIDFSVLGVALKSSDALTLEQHILDLIADGPLGRELARTREEYLKKNPHFARPYTFERIESFIACALQRAVQGITRSIH
jgi:hypothetical protein